MAEGQRRYGGAQRTRARRHAGHGYGPADRRAGAARGAAFERLFLKLMITHQQGAVTMATDVLSAGNDIQVGEWATEVTAQQTSEIARMRGLR
nr:DUF305 domain-containing protein [Actinacidiphila oryziradicis]